MNCEGARPLIDAYIDGELEWTKKLELETHVAGCPGCSQALEARQQLSQAIKHAATYVPAPPSLVNLMRRRTATRRKWRWGLAAAGFAFAALAFAEVIVSRNSSDPMPFPSGIRLADVSQAVDCTQTVDKASSDPTAVRDWFKGKTDPLPMVYDVANSGFQLIGARFCNLAGHAVPTLVYKKNGHVINVLVTLGCAVPPVNTDQSAIHIRSWDDCGICYWAVSAEEPKNLDDIQKAFLLHRVPTASTQPMPPRKMTPIRRP